MGASLGTGNRGVSALGSSLVGLFNETTPESQVVMLIGNRSNSPFYLNIGAEKRTIPVVNFRISPKSPAAKNIFVIVALSMVYRAMPLKRIRTIICRICPWIDCVAKADLVGDIRGGDSFSDIYGAVRFAIASLPAIAVIWIRGDILLFPQTYGPFGRAVSRTIAKYILRRSAQILVRDSESKCTVAELIGPTDNVHFCPDVAFSLESVQRIDIQIEPPIPHETRTVLVGLNINGLMYNGGYTRNNMFQLKLIYKEFLKELAGMLLKDHLVRILLIPHTFAPQGSVESDTDASNALIATMSDLDNKRCHLVKGEYDQNEIKGIIGTCDFFIGSRMHSCIAGLSQGIPTIGVAYSKKFHGVFETVGASDWVIDARNMASESALSKIADHFENREGMRVILEKNAAKAREQLRHCFSTILKSNRP
jgi:colanic acid/amylovoran biosynthesis protein